MSNSARVVTSDKPYGEWDFPLPVGMDYYLNVIWRDSTGAATDLTGYYVELELRFNGQPVLNLNTDDGGIITATIDGDDGVTIHFPYAKTRALVLAPHQYFFRVRDPGDTVRTTVFAGNANLIPS